MAKKFWATTNSLQEFKKLNVHFTLMVISEVKST